MFRYIERVAKLPKRLLKKDSAFVYRLMPRMAAHFDEMGQRPICAWGGVRWLSTSIGVSLLRRREQVRQVFTREAGCPISKHRRFVVDSAIRPEASFGWAN